SGCSSDHEAFSVLQSGVINKENGRFVYLGRIQLKLALLSWPSDKASFTFWLNAPLLQCTHGPSTENDDAPAATPLPGPRLRPHLGRRAGGRGRPRRHLAAPAIQPRLPRLHHPLLLRRPDRQDAQGPADPRRA